MKRILFAALAACALSACERVEIAENGDMGGVISDSYSKKFTFTVKGDFQNPTFSDGQTRANAYMTADGVEMTDLWVVDCKDGSVVQSLHQVKDDAGWGEPSMALTLGTHHVLFLASRGQNPTYTNGVVTWTRPNDTFYLDYEVTVAKTSNGNRAVTLNRVATKMSLVIEDAIPNGTTSVTFAPETWFCGWNMLTGAPVAADGYVARYDLPQAWWGGMGSTLNMWGLSGSDEWQTDVAIESRAGEAVNASAVIADAPFVANRSTVYRGKLYSNDANSSVSLSAEWLQAYEGVY